MTLTKPSIYDDLDLYAIPGHRNVIDMIHPVTGLSWYSGLTEAQIIERDPTAKRYTWPAWRDEVSAAQRTPITWSRTDRRTYWRMLEVLPPALMVGGAFLVGEPYDHDVANGQPRFQGYKHRGANDDSGEYYVASRPMTCSELRVNLGLAPSDQTDYVS